ncbi:hypothetical protein N9C84_01725 [Desulfobacterales bacterium]|nr:hypothetical protein [Desulfobacterales bacterium]
MLLWTSRCPTPTPWSHANLCALRNGPREAAPRQTVAPPRAAGRWQRLDHAVYSGTLYTASASATNQSTCRNRLMKRTKALTINHE